MVQINLQNRNRATDAENNLMITGGGGGHVGREGYIGIDKDTYYLSYTDLLYSTVYTIAQGTPLNTLA